MRYGYIRPIALYDEINDQKQKLEAHTPNIFTEEHTDTKGRDQLDILLKHPTGSGMNYLIPLVFYSYETPAVFVEAVPIIKSEHSDVDDAIYLTPRVSGHRLKAIQ